MDTLGKGGLAQQVKATDEGGKTLLMYAARYACDVKVFRDSLKLMKGLFSQEDIRCICKDQDIEGRNLLHHAAEARSDQMLEEVTI